jgi:hypothetical protein
MLFERSVHYASIICLHSRRRCNYRRVLSSFFSIDLHQGSYCHKFCEKLIVHPKVNSMATSVPTWCIVCETIFIIHTAGILLTLCFRQSINQLNQSSNQSINPSINISVMCYIILSIRKVWRYKWDRIRKSKKNRQHKDFASLLYSGLITGCVTSWTRRVPSVEQELPTLPEHLGSITVFSRVRVTRSLVICVCFVGSFVTQIFHNG